MVAVSNERCRAGASSASRAFGVTGLQPMGPRLPALRRVALRALALRALALRALALRRLAPAICLAGLVALACGQPASAGQYHVYSCRTPWGAPAPVDGWSSSKSGAYTYARRQLLAVRRCASSRRSETACPAKPTPTSLPGPSLHFPASRSRRQSFGVQATLTVVRTRRLLSVLVCGPRKRPQPTKRFGQCEAGVRCPTGVGELHEPLSAKIW